jgi:hypothetical protein
VVQVITRDVLGDAGSSDEREQAFADFVADLRRVAEALPTP